MSCRNYTSPSKTAFSTIKSLINAGNYLNKIQLFLNFNLIFKSIYEQILNSYITYYEFVFIHQIFIFVVFVGSIRPRNFSAQKKDINNMSKHCHVSKP